MKYILSALALAAAVTSASGADAWKRIFHPARHTRGNLNVVQVQELDTAHWIWTSGESKVGQAVKFRKGFWATAEKCTIDVSADERFVLFLDGKYVARGPNRGTVENWQYHTYEFSFEPGYHVFTAVVWRHGWGAPLAQMTTGKGGFVLKASGSYDKQLTTGVAEWQAGELAGTYLGGGAGGGTFGVGATLTVKGTGLLDAEPAEWQTARVVRGPAGADIPEHSWGGRTGDWMLYPAQLEDQIEVTRRVGTFKSAVRGASGDVNAVFATEGEKDPILKDFQKLLDAGTAFTVPTGTEVTVAWDLGNYYCAYPELCVSGGAGAEIRWGWNESPYVDVKNAVKGHRDVVVGKSFSPYEDIFRPDGRKDARFTATWWRCGRWCSLKIKTGAEPLTFTGISFNESRYPLEDESVFACDDPSFGGIRRICARGMQMCCHEMLFDCPYYEQQMYPGDTRVQLNVLTAMMRDDRMIKRAIEIYDLARRDDGMIPMNFPTRGTQESVTYTLCYALMYDDYLMWHDDEAWLAARMPGLRHTMHGLEIYENADGLLADLPGWSFMDWVPGWPAGTVPGVSHPGKPPCAEINLFYVLAMQTMAKLEAHAGKSELAAYWTKKAAATVATVRKVYWDAKRGMLADDPAHTRWSEHSQCLALLGDMLPEADAKRAFQALVTEKDLDRTTVYFSYYLFDTYFKFGRGDLFVERLDLWRDYVKTGMSTPLEAPSHARSDCHAWGSHPLFFMQAGLAGVRPASPGFKTVRVAPCPGALKHLSSKTPHPKGYVETDLVFKDGKVSGRVTLPEGVTGVFVWKGAERALKPGVNML